MLSFVWYSLLINFVKHCFFQDKPGVHDCGYCGNRFIKAPHHWAVTPTCQNIPYFLYEIPTIMYIYCVKDFLGYCWKINKMSVYYFENKKGSKSGRFLRFSILLLPLWVVMKNYSINFEYSYVQLEKSEPQFHRNSPIKSFVRSIIDNSIRPFKVISQY